ncbi:hypothetical protein CLV65_0160 [Pseudoscardovia suis]|uniref:Uncharacterized protein n=1 Tax=Pseudoscardovia suis TaxID=987063 RepID=A0A261EYL0_9BIFI|nr:hypothetical protein PSSU_0727 [Pseudoscardovia suis]PJJ69458.1 hypothetical protein CLV65_0160 [Pseudoscardovia suis]
MMEVTDPENGFLNSVFGDPQTIRRKRRLQPQKTDP